MTTRNEARDKAVELQLAVLRDQDVELVSELVKGITVAEMIPAIGHVVLNATAIIRSLCENVPDGEQMVETLLVEMLNEPERYWSL